MIFVPIVQKDVKSFIKMLKKELHIGFDAKRLFMNNTGLGNYSRTLVRNLYQYFPEHHYHLFTPKVVKNAATEFFIENNFSIHTPPPYMPSRFWRSWMAGKVDSKIKLDIYHGLSHEIPYGLSPETISVVSMHDLIYEKMSHLFAWYDVVMYKARYRSSCRRADYIVAVSNHTAEDIAIHYHLSEDKIHTLYQSCHDVFQQEAPLIKNKAYYLYVGTISERKALLDVVKAYLELPEQYRLPVVVVGTGGSYYQKVVDLIHKEKLDAYFVFKGNLDNENLVKLYDDAMCLLLPSVYEGFGIPIVESLFRKTPVITTNVSALPEAAGPGAILVTPGNVQEISKAMIAMHDTTNWNMLSDMGFNYVNERYTGEVTAGKLMAFYEKITNLTDR